MCVPLSVKSELKSLGSHYDFVVVFLMFPFNVQKLVGSKQLVDNITVGWLTGGLEETWALWGGG